MPESYQLSETWRMGFILRIPLSYANTPTHDNAWGFISSHSEKQTSAVLNPTSAAIINHQEQPAITPVTFTQKSRK